MSDSPTGPWRCKGTIMDPDVRSSGNHPVIIDYKGKSYVFGFNYAVNFALTKQHRERRLICMEQMTYNADGTIQKHPWWSTNGIAQIGNFNPFAQTEAATICWETGVRTQNRGGETGVYVTVNTNGAYIKIKSVDLSCSFKCGGRERCSCAVLNSDF
jgi:arabinoxylan arabinofuranohydrolase